MIKYLYTIQKINEINGINTLKQLEQLSKELNDFLNKYTVSILVIMIALVYSQAMKIIKILLRMILIQ